MAKIHPRFAFVCFELVLLLGLVSLAVEGSSEGLPVTPQLLLKKNSNVDSTIKYQFAGAWPQQGPMGQVTAVDILRNISTQQQILYIFQRATRIWDYHSFDRQNRILYREPIHEPTVVVMDPKTGQVLSKWGQDKFYMPHGLTIDHERNIWLTDVGTHQVYKFSSDGQLLLTLGTHLEPGQDRTHFCKPADVAVMRDGSFFVADGYCNSRIIKFSADGQYQAEWGSFGAGNGLGRPPEPGQFFVPHGLDIDHERNLLFVADRENGRVQVFRTVPPFEFVQQFYSRSWLSRVYGVKYVSSNRVLPPTTTTNNTTATSSSGRSYEQGLIYVLSGPNNYGIGVHACLLDVKTGQVVTCWGDEQFSEPHDLAVDVERNGKITVYVADIQRNKLFSYRKGQ
jgi:hypothetical protein